MSYPIPSVELDNINPNLPEENEPQEEGGLCGKLIRECQEVQRKAFTFEGICEQLGYGK